MSLWYGNRFSCSHNRTQGAGLYRPNTPTIIARDKFAQKLSGPRRDIIAPMFAKQFITKATERRVIVDV
jgi:hypothetical protein